MVIFGILIVALCVIGGFVLGHGQLLLLWQPTELLIIIGAAIGAFIISNSGKLVKITITRTLSLLFGITYSKKYYMNLLGLLFIIGSKIRRAGLIGIEDDIEAPYKSPLFKKYPTILKNKRLLQFITDNIRLIVSTQLSRIEFENLLTEEIEAIEEDLEKPNQAMLNVSEALPGFGIVAAVLGIVITMQSIDGDPKILGLKVAAALVGTFLGVLLAYGFVGPVALRMQKYTQEELNCYQCVKVFLVAFSEGASPKLAMEYARKIIAPILKPSFLEVEKLSRVLKAGKY